jgi:dihydroneopterin aldolase
MWIRIKSLKLFAHHGVYDFEKKGGGLYEFDVELRIPDSSGSHDELQETIDYALVIERVKSISDGRSYNLLEKLAGDVSIAVLSVSPLIEEVIVRVRKTKIPLDADLEYFEVENRVTK